MNVPPVPPLIDLHSHVLPAFDDGAADLEEALATLEDLEADGVVSVCATPHLRASAIADSEVWARVDKAWHTLVAAAPRRLKALSLYRGCEILLDDAIGDFSRPGLRLGGSRSLLVEFYAFTIPPESVGLLKSVVDGGVRPVLAHAERYLGYRGRYEVVEQWRRAGVVIQVNSGSLLGEYGDLTLRQATVFLERGWVDFLASDTHARPGRSPSIRSAYDALVESGAREQAELLLSVNPRHILEDRPMVVVPPVVRRRGLADRLLEWLRARQWRIA